MKEINYIILVTQNIVLMCIPFLVVLISRLYKDQRVDKKVIELLEHTNHMQETKIKELKRDIEILCSEGNDLEKISIKTKLNIKKETDRMLMYGEFNRSGNGVFNQSKKPQ